MLSLMISGPRQPSNDIDVYVAPLVEDLKRLWDEGVEVYDAHAREMFTLCAMLLCTLNDFLAYGNLAGYKIKGKKPCPICIDDLHYTWVGNKHVYWCNRRFLPRDHPYRKKKKAFNGEVENGVAHRPLMGYEVYKKVHIEKNVCDAILATLFNIPGKTKDGKVVRYFLQKKKV